MKYYNLPRYTYICLSLFYHIILCVLYHIIDCNRHYMLFLVFYILSLHLIVLCIVNMYYIKLYCIICLLACLFVRLFRCAIYVYDSIILMCSDVVFYVFLLSNLYMCINVFSVWMFILKIHVSSIYSVVDTLWLFNMTVENHHFQWENPRENPL